MYKCGKKLFEHIFLVFCLLFIAYSQCSAAGVDKKTIETSSQIRFMHGRGINVIDLERAEGIRRSLLEQNVNFFEINSIPFAPEAFELIVQGLVRKEGVEKLTMLGLVQNSLGSAAAPMVARIIEANPQLTHLDISNNNFGPDGRQIVNVLRNSRNLQLLNLSGNNLGPETIPLIADLLRNNLQLNDINLEGNNFGFSGDELVAALRGNGHLTEMNFRNRNFGPEMVPVFVWFIKHNVGITKINLEGNHFGPGIIQIVKAIRNLSNLEVIEVRNSALGSEAVPILTEIAESNPRLTRIMLARNGFGSAGKQIIEGLGNHTNLEYFDFEGNDLGREAARSVREVIMNNPGLSHIGLRGNNFSIDGERFLWALENNRNLSQLTLDGNDMGFGAVNHIATIFRANPGLTQVRLGRNNFGFNARVIIEALLDRTNLTVLDLSHNNLGNKPDLLQQISQSIAEIIRANPQLTDIRLGGNNLGPEAIRIVEALRNRTNLTRLELGGNDLGPKAVTDIVNIIHANPRLTDIRFGGNNFGPEANRIVEALRGRNDLVGLDLMFNNLGPNTVPVVTEIIRANPQLIQIGLGGNNFGSDGLHILEILRNRTNLTALGLQGNHLGVGALPFISEIIRSNPELNVFSFYDNNLGIDLQSFRRDLDSLQLSHRNLGPANVPILAEIIRANPGLTDIYLHGNNFGPGDYRIFEALQHRTNLNIVHLDGNNLERAAIPLVARIIEANPRIRTFQLRNNNFGFNSFTYFGADNESHLQYSNLGPEAVPIIVAMIRAKPRLLDVDLSGSNFGPGGREMVEALRGQTNLMDLNLSGNNLGDEVVPFLAEVIRQNPGLHAVNLSGNNFGPAGQQIVETLQNLTNLSHLNLGSNNLGPAVVPTVAEVIRTNPNFNYITLDGNNFGPDGQQIVEALRNPTDLRGIDLSGNNFGPAITPVLAEVIRANPQLILINLSGNNFGHSGQEIVAALRDRTNLASLRLDDNILGPEAVPAIANIIRANTRLAVVGLGGNGFGPEGLRILNAMRNNSGISELDISSNALGPQAVPAIAGIIRANRNLTNIRLGRNNFGPAGVQILGAMQDMRKIRRLEFGNNQLGPTAAPIFASIVRNNTRLSVINLNRNNIGPAAQEIFEALRNRTDLTQLSLGSNNLGPAAVPIFTDIIRSNPSLANINIADNNFGPFGIPILEVLRNRTNLTQLDLRNNNLGPDVIPLLVEIIRANPELNDLQFAGNNIGFEVPELLQLSRNLEEFNIADNNLGPETVPLIAEIIRINSGLMNVNVSGNNFGVAGRQLLEGLRNTRRLTSLDLSNNNLALETIHLIAEIIMSNQNLANLSLDGNDFGEEFHESQIIMDLQNNGHLKYFTLSRENLGFEVAPLVIEIIRSNRDLTHIFLDGNNFGVSVRQMLELLRERTNLVEVTLDSHGLNSDVVSLVVDIIQRNPNLENFHIEGDSLGSQDHENINAALALNKRAKKGKGIVPPDASREVDTLKSGVVTPENASPRYDGERYIANSATTTKTKTTTTTTAAAIPTGEQIAAEIAALRIASVENASVSENNSLSNEKPEDKEEILQNTMKSVAPAQKSDGVITDAKSSPQIDFKNRFIPEEEVHEIISMIRDNPQLTHVDFGNNFLTSSVNGVIQVDYELQVLEALSNRTNLTYLGIRGFSLRISSHIKLTAQIIRNNPQLTCVSLKRDPIQKSNDQIWAALREMRNLVNLDLSVACASSEMNASIVEIVRSNPNLVELTPNFFGNEYILIDLLQGNEELITLDFSTDFTHRMLMSEGIPFIAEIIRTNPRLNSINLQGQYHLFGKHWKLSRALENIRNLQKLDISSDNLNSEMVPIIVELIRANPDLVDVEHTGNSFTNGDIRKIEGALQNNRALNSDERSTAQGLRQTPRLSTTSTTVTTATTTNSGAALAHDQLDAELANLNISADNETAIPDPNQQTRSPTARSSLSVLGTSVLPKK